MNHQSRKANLSMRETREEFTYHGTVMLKLSIRYPEVRLPGNPLAEARINGRIRSEINRFTRYASGPLYRQAIRDYKDAQQNGYPFRTYEAVLNYEVTYNENCHLSAFRDQYEYAGGAHGGTIRASDTWDLRTGARMPLARFFPPRIHYRRILLDQILKQADRNMQQNPGIYFEDYRALIHKYFNEESYYLTPQGLAIYYQQYEIAPYATGIVVFVLPYRAPLLRPSCREPQPPGRPRGD